MLGIKSVTYESKNVFLHLNISDKTISYMNIKQEINQNNIFNYLERLFRMIDTWHNTLVQI
ncbi:MAG: hypothetical protein PHX04_04465 [Bacilli bacterium]|nr:hypothetical protein [Bacilli bacterium]